MIDNKDFIIKTKKNGNNLKQFKATCDTCKNDRGYVDKSKADKLCRSCTRKQIHASWSPEKKKEVGQKSTKHFIGSEPWNKGKTGIYSEELIEQWSEKHTIISSDPEYRIAMSCAKRNIQLSEFEDFSTVQEERDRSQIKSRGLSKQCFERDHYTCAVCKIRGTELNAHHMNSFDKFPDERLDLNNLTTLCKNCHDSFHEKYGKGSNTKEQYLLFKTEQEPTLKKTLYLLTGAPASGKSWILSNLSNFDCLDSDTIPKKELVSRCQSANKPILTLTVGISTFIKNNPNFEIKLIVIVEGIDTLNQRMLARNGKITSTIEKRAKRMDALAKQAIFSGTSQEVLSYLSQLRNIVQ